MSHIAARQLIYTRVEEAYSPSHKSGFQVYFCSSGLREEVITSIVSKVNDFQPHRPDLKRWQCFFLADKSKVILSQTQIIDSHPKIIDLDSRPHIPIAHCLVFDWEDYKKIGCNPFLVFDTYNFVSSAIEMVERYNQNDNIESQSPAIFLIPPLIDDDFDNTWINHAYELALLASPGFFPGKSSSLFYGDGREIYTAIRSIFIYSPPSYRENLTFDTYIKGRQVPNGEFSFVGLPEWRSGYQISFDTTNKSFSAPPPGYSDIYLTWLQKNYQNRPSGKELSSVQIIADSFLLKQVPPKELIQASAISSFYNVHQHYIFPRAFNTTAAVLGKDLATKFRDFFRTHCSEYELIAIAATGRISRDKMAWLLQQWLCQLDGELIKFSQNEWNIIKKISLGINDNVLSYWSAIFTNDKKLLQQVMLLINTDEYLFILNLLGKPLRPLSLYIPKFSALFVDKLTDVLDTLTEREYVDIIGQILNVGDWRVLNKLVSFIPKMGNKELTRLQKAMSNKLTPPEFDVAVQQRRTQVGKPLGIVDTILRRK